MNGMTKADRDQPLARLRAKQAEREAEPREKILLAEVQNQLTADFDAHDALWAEAVTIAEEAAAKANAHIRLACADLGIPSNEAAPQLELGWQSRSPRYSDSSRRAELLKLAETRLAALTKTAKTAIQDKLLVVETELIAGRLASADAKAFLETSMPTAEQLMPRLSLDDLGVVRWQPPEDLAGQLTAPLTPADRKRRRILRAIANPGASNHAIAKIVGVDHKTVAAHRRSERGEFPTAAGELPRDFPRGDEGDSA